MTGYFQTALVDGMMGQGFTPTALQRLYNNDFGYYLHLHGSPLFYDRHGITYKRDRHQLNQMLLDGYDHIVLTHVRHKRSVIGASLVLSTYWNYLNFCLAESEEIIVFGYSGYYDHLNELIAAHAQVKHLVIVEWTGAGRTQQERMQYWSQKLCGQRFHLWRLDNILQFNSWNYIY